MTRQSHMAQEVAEIPDAVARFLTGSRTAAAQAGHAFREIDPRFVVSVARGSSDHAAAYLKYAIELAAGIPVASVGPSIASVYGRRLRLEQSVCIGISQSGQSPDIVEMMRSAREGGAMTLAITNHPDSPMGMASDHCLALHAGQEHSVAATKTFVCSVVAGLAVLAEWQQDTDLRRALEGLPDALTSALRLDWEPLSARLSRAQSLFVLGRGPAYAIACETALKFKETSGLHAEAYSAAEVLHGPAAIVQPHFPVLALAVDDAARPKVIETAERLARQGADVFVTGCAAEGTLRLPAAPALHPLLDPLILAASIYCFMEALARRRGFDPDAPPHLRKVTETV